MDPFGWNSKQLQALASVSKRWYHTMISFPEFWSCLDIRQAPNTRETALRRNHQGPIDVRCETVGTRYGELNPQVEEYLCWARYHAQRWRSFVYRGGLTPATADVLHFATNLESLCLDVSNSIHPIDIDGATSLRHLEVQRTSLVWERCRPMNLTSLILRNVKTDVPCLEQMKGILSTCKGLQRIILEHLGHIPVISLFETGSSNNATTQVAEAIILPELTTLVLNSVPKSLTHFLTHHVTSPNCRTLIVSDSFPPNPMENSTFRDLLGTAISSANRLHLSYDQRRRTINIRSTPAPSVSNKWCTNAPDGEGVDVQIQACRSLAAWTCISPVFANLSLPPIDLTISLSFNPSDSDHLTPFNILNSCPTVETLSLASSTDVGPIIEYLSEPRYQDGQGRLIWPCPRLTTLLAEGWRCRNNQEAMQRILLPFILNRWREDVMLVDEVDAVPPAKLCKVVIPYPLRMCAERMLPPGVDVWE